MIDQCGEKKDLRNRNQSQKLREGAAKAVLGGDVLRGISKKTDVLHQESHLFQ